MVGQATAKHQAPTHGLKLYNRAVIESESYNLSIQSMYPKLNWNWRVPLNRNSHSKWGWGWGLDILLAKL